MPLLGKAHVVSFNYDKEAICDTGSEYGPTSRGRYVGLLAQEMIEWAPWAVNAGDAVDCPTCQAGKPCDDHKHMWKAEYDHLVPLTIKGLQECNTRIGDAEGAIMTSHLKLQTKIETNSERIARLEAEIAELKKAA
jgi:hypothetical protein